MQRKTPTKAEVLGDLQTMLRDVLRATDGGRSYPRTARAHGYIDGFMRGLLDSGFATREELLEIVTRERAHAAGPATKHLEAETGDGDPGIVAA